MERSTATKDRRAARWDLARKVGAMTAEEREALAARIGCVFNPDRHALSITNTILLYMQSGGGVPLTMVAGFNQWIKAGRCVRKGEHSIGSIMVPLGRRTDDGRLEPRDGERMRFRFVPVFDVSQTDELGAAAALENQGAESERAA